jgi:hypothetical protein
LNAGGPWKDEHFASQKSDQNSARDSQAEFFVSTASGEFDDGGNPAKSRAVSSAIDPSEPCARAALSITTSVVRMAATILFTGKRHRLRNIREEKSGPGRRLPPH